MKYDILKKMVLVIVSLTSLLSCEKEDKTQPNIPKNIKELTAILEKIITDKKTSLTEMDSLVWTEGSSINVFPYSNDIVFTLSEGKGKSIGTFINPNGVNLFDNDSIHAIINTSSEPSYFNSSILFALPSIQNYQEAGTIDFKSFPAIATSKDENLSFKNLCGILELQLTGDGTEKTKVHRVIVNSANVPLSGNAKVLTNSNLSEVPTIIWDTLDYNNSINRVILDCGKGGVQLDDVAKSFYIALPPLDLKTLSIMIKMTDSSVYSKNFADSEREIVRSKRLTLNTIECTPTGDSDVDYFKCGGYFVDRRDKLPRKYRTALVTISGITRCWMIDNLDVGEFTSTEKMNNGWYFDDKGIQKLCYDNDIYNSIFHGSLYTWLETITGGYSDKISLEDVNNVNINKHGKLTPDKKYIQGICPDGWRLPTNAEWMGNDDNNIVPENFNVQYAGRYLEGSFSRVDVSGVWWMYSTFSWDNYTMSAGNKKNTFVPWTLENLSSAYSVRCILNE